MTNQLKRRRTDVEIKDVTLNYFIYQKSRCSNYVALGGIWKLSFQSPLVI